MIIPITAAVFVIVSMIVFSVDHLALSSFEVLNHPFAFEPWIAALVLLVSLAVAIVIAYRAGARIASERASIAAIILALATTPLFAAPLTIDRGFLAAPLLLLVTYQLATRRYRLWWIAPPIAALIAMGFGVYPLLLLVLLLLTSPLRSDPDPRLGELFLVTALGVLLVSMPSFGSFSVEPLFNLGLVFVGLAAFAVYRILATESENAHPFVALGLASAALYLLGDPFGVLAFTLSAAVLIARSFDSIFRFLDVSNLPFKRLFAIGIVVVAVVLALVQSTLFLSLTSDERMDPDLAASLSSFDEPVAIESGLAPAFEYYTGSRAFALNDDEVYVLEESRFVVPVLEKVRDRFDVFAVREMPPYAQSECFSTVDHGRLVEVRIACSFS